MTLELAHRKIQRIGDSYFVAIPMPWFRHHNLHRGSVVVAEIDTDINTLHIRPYEEKSNV